VPLGSATSPRRSSLPGHGEKVVQETTGAPSNGSGQATPARSKVKQGRWSGPLHSSPG
jgi:hypothetical protein